MKAVVLCGGKGKRLEPYTTLLPKPLLPVGEFPVLEIIVRKLKNEGFKEVFFAVGYLADLIMAYFMNGSKFGITIHYSKEEEPLGTVGPLNLLKDKLKDEPFLVMNGDVITDLNLRNFMEFHRQREALLTIAVTERKITIEYGVVEEKNGLITEYTEKPIYNFLVSMGLYAFNPDIFKYLEDERKIDFPELVNKLLKNNERIFTFFHKGYWLDIGTESDFRRAQNDSEIIKSMIFQPR